MAERLCRAILPNYPSYENDVVKFSYSIYRNSFLSKKYCMPKVSLMQLAGQLGASLSTVSKLPYNSYETGAGTKQQVLQMAEQIGYQASPYTGCLRHHKGRTIAVFVPELSNNFLIQASGDAESVAREQDYHILFYVTQKDFRQKDRMLKHLSMGRVDGMIMSLAANTKTYDFALLKKPTAILLLYTPP